jgi:hypothetical protein
MAMYQVKQICTILRMIALPRRSETAVESRIGTALNNLRHAGIMPGGRPGAPGGAKQGGRDDACARRRNDRVHVFQGWPHTGHAGIS